MMKLFARFFLLFLVVTLVSCGEGSGRSRKNSRRTPPATLPEKGAKIALVFPAGAGAMGASLAVTAELEKDLGKNLKEVIVAAGGVSSGSLAAAAIVTGLSSKDLAAQLGTLVSTVFSDAQALVDKLIRDYQFTFAELETLFDEISKEPPKFTDQATAEAGLERVLTATAKAKISVLAKINAKGDTKAFIAAISPSVMAMLNQEVTRANALRTAINTVIGDMAINDPKLDKLLVLANADLKTKKPVFFGAAQFASFVNAPFAVSGTRLSEALISSSAIPNFIKAPTTLSFTAQDGSGPTIMPDIIDGVYATDGRFDASATFYDIFTKRFAGEELLIVYVGNGAPYDKQFRSKLRAENGIRNGVSQKTLSNGKKVTFVAIDTTIEDDNKNSVFNVSSFYAHKDLTRFMQNAGEKARSSNAYKWALDAMKAALP